MGKMNTRHLHSVARTTTFEADLNSCGPTWWDQGERQCGHSWSGSSSLSGLVSGVSAECSPSHKILPMTRRSSCKHALNKIIVSLCFERISCKSQLFVMWKFIHTVTQQRDSECKHCARRDRCFQNLVSQTCKVRRVPFSSFSSDANA